MTAPLQLERYRRRRGGALIAAIGLPLAVFWLHRDNVVALTTAGQWLSTGVTAACALAALVVAVPALRRRNTALFAGWPAPLRWSVKGAMVLFAALLAGLVGDHAVDIVLDRLAFEPVTLAARFVGTHDSSGRRRRAQFAELQFEAPTPRHVRLRVDRGLIERVQRDDLIARGDAVIVQARSSRFGTFADRIVPAASWR